MKIVSAQISKLVETFEFEIPLINEEPLLFKLEVWMQEVRSSRHYRCRLYRLESFRLQLRPCPSDVKKIEGADYRLWVMDDNLGVDIPQYISVSTARKKALETIKAQLGI